MLIRERTHDFVFTTPYVKEWRYRVEPPPGTPSILDVEPLFVGLDGGRWSAVTSGLTLLETLVVPYRAGDTALAERYEALLSRSRGLRLVELDRVFFVGVA